MTDAFKPEADRLEQEAELQDSPAGPEPGGDLPREASEADALEQLETVEEDPSDEYR